MRDTAAAASMAAVFMVVSMEAAFTPVFMAPMGFMEAMDCIGGHITGVLGATPITGDTIIPTMTAMTRATGDHTATDTITTSDHGVCHDNHDFSFHRFLHWLSDSDAR